MATIVGQNSHWTLILMNMEVSKMFLKLKRKDYDRQWQLNWDGEKMESTKDWTHLTSRFPMAARWATGIMGGDIPPEAGLERAQVVKGRQIGGTQGRG